MFYWNCLAAEDAQILECSFGELGWGEITLQKALPLKPSVIDVCPQEPWMDGCFKDIICDLAERMIRLSLVTRLTL